MQLLEIRPNPKQQRFLEAVERYVAYGGARGGGKSWVARVKAVLLALFWDGIIILILRRNYPELEKNHIQPLRDLLEPRGARYSEKNKTLYINKSQIIFGYCDNDNDLRRYQGNEYDVIFIDEATQFLWEWFDKLKACVRGVNNFPRRMYLTCNPGDVGHAWVKRLFIDRDFLPNENPDDYVFIPATVYDNGALMESDPEYVKNLESLSPELRDAWLYGKWDSFVGQYFTEWRQDVHIIDDFEPPASWRRYVAMDYGLDMLAAYCIAVDSNGCAYVYREVYQSGLIISKAAERLIDMVGDDDIFQVFAPPDMWNRRQETGKSVAEIFEENGVTLTRAENDRISGWMDMHEWLKVVQADDGSQTAALRVMRSCRNLTRCIPLLQFDDKKINDVATEPHEITHAPDAIRYFCAGRPRGEPQSVKKVDPLPFALQTESTYTGGVMDW